MEYPVGRLVCSQSRATATATGSKPKDGNSGRPTLSLLGKDAMFEPLVPKIRSHATFVRVQKGGFAVGLICSSDLVCSRTHYVNRRRWLCCGLNCPMCARGSAVRSYGWICYREAIGRPINWQLTAARGQVKVLELPAAATSFILNGKTTDKAMLGKAFQATRDERSSVATVEFAWLPHVDHQETVPPNLDIEACVLTLFGYPARMDSQTEGEFKANCVDHVNQQLFAAE